jgi:hypothetical protein
MEVTIKHIQKQFPGDYKYWQEIGWLNKRTYLKERVKGGVLTMFSNRFNWQLVGDYDKYIW